MGAPSRVHAHEAADPVVIRLPGEPRGKGRHRSRIARSAARGDFVQTYADPKTEAFEARLKRSAADVMGDRPLFSGALAVAVWAYRAIPASMSKGKRALAVAGLLRPTTKPDADNYAKVLDALNGIVWVDDALVVSLHAEKHYAEKPALVIRVEPWVPPEPPAMVPTAKRVGLFAGALA